MSFIYRPIYWLYRSGGGMWHRSRRRFTTAGLCVALGLMVTAAVSSDRENTVSYQSFALLLGMLLPAIAGSLFFRGKFSATRRLPRFGTAGQPLRYEVVVKNLTRKRQGGLELLEDIADPRPSYKDWLAFQLAESRRVRPFSWTQRRRRDPFRLAESGAVEGPTLSAGGEGSATAEVLPLRRGVLRFAGVTVARADPLGLFRSFVKVAAPQSVLILPKRYPLPPMALPGASRYQQGGVALAASVGVSEEFVALRDYRPGDPLRHIHWRSWARAGQPIVKEFEDEFFVRHALVLDTFDDEPYSELLEEAVSVAASFACAVLTQESLLDLLFVGNQSYCFTAGRGLAHTEQMLEVLASVRNSPGGDFAALERLVLNHLTVVSGCICVLQRWDAPRQRLVKRLRAAGLPLRVMVLARPGEKLKVAPEDEKDLQALEIGKIEEQLMRLA